MQKRSKREQAERRCVKRAENRGQIKRGKRRILREGSTEKGEREQ